jgi:hypothetical protein
MGGDAAWDIGVAHPDLWAGVIPIASLADRYVAHYWENARNLPMYLVGGELDGDKNVKNSRDLNKYMLHGYNVTVVEYQGRGHEHFSDEILKLFDWMGRQERDFFPKKLDCRSMRTWDNFFWWIEISDAPARSIVEPDNWPPPRNFLPARAEANLTATNGVNVQTAAAAVTVWLAPEMIDFQKPIKVTINSARVKTSGPSIDPDITVMLEDVRTRGDRRHPFWAKVEMPGSRINVAGR